MIYVPTRVCHRARAARSYRRIEAVAEAATETARQAGPVKGLADDRGADHLHASSMVDTSDTPRFLCDRMLERLGRYLRAAGYDASIAEPAETDGTIVRRIECEHRVLLTCDRELAARANVSGSAVLLPANGLDAAAHALGDRIAVDWLRAPFSRCLVDNTPVVPAGERDRKRLPPRARRIGGDVMLCGECGRLYWPGSHVRRMMARLRRWNHRRGHTGQGPVC